MKICANDRHVWKPVRVQRMLDLDNARTISSERCDICGTIFPCPKSGCGHIDCHEHRGEPLPEGITAA